MEKCGWCKTSRALWSGRLFDKIVKLCRNCKEIYMHRPGTYELSELFQSNLEPNRTFKNMLQEKILLIRKELEKEKKEIISIN